MKKSFLAMLHILPSFSMKLVAPAPDNHKAGNGSDAQADASDQRATSPKSSSISEEDGFGEVRWVYCGHYRSIFPPMF